MHDAELEELRRRKMAQLQQSQESQLQQQAMAADFSWRRAANDYMDIYHRLHPEIIRYNKRRDR